MVNQSGAVAVAVTVQVMEFAIQRNKIEVRHIILGFLPMMCLIFVFCYLISLMGHFPPRIMAHKFQGFPIP